MLARIASGIAAIKNASGRSARGSACDRCLTGCFAFSGPRAMRSVGVDSSLTELWMCLDAGSHAHSDQVPSA